MKRRRRNKQKRRQMTAEFYFKKPRFYIIMRLIHLTLAANGASQLSTTIFRQRVSCFASAIYSYLLADIPAPFSHKQNKSNTISTIFPITILLIYSCSSTLSMLDIQQQNIRICF